MRDFGKKNVLNKNKKNENLKTTNFIDSTGTISLLKLLAKKRLKK
jgi:hypothetical protein